MEHPIFFISKTSLSRSCVVFGGHSLGEGRSAGRRPRVSPHKARSPTPRPTCQAAECAGSCGATLAIHTTGERGDTNGEESEGRKEEGGQEEITAAVQFPTPNSRRRTGSWDWELALRSIPGSHHLESGR